MFMSTLKSVCVAAVVVVGCLGVVHASNEALTSDGVVEAALVGDGAQELPPKPTLDQLARLRSGRKSRASKGAGDMTLNAKATPDSLVKSPKITGNGKDDSTVVDEIPVDASRQITDCFQYSFTEESICENGQDNILCQWDPSSEICNSQCDDVTGEWFSIEWQECYDKTGKCSQYDFTDASTCTTGNDDILCSWDSNSLICKAQ